MIGSEENMSVNLSCVPVSQFWINSFQYPNFTHCRKANPFHAHQWEDPSTFFLTSADQSRCLVTLFSLFGDYDDAFDVGSDEFGIHSPYRDGDGGLKVDFWGWRVMGSIMAAIVRAIEAAATPLSRRKNPLRESGGRERKRIFLPCFCDTAYLFHISILLLHSSYSVLGRNVVRFLLIKMFWVLSHSYKAFETEYITNCNFSSN